LLVLGLVTLSLLNYFELFSLIYAISLIFGITFIISYTYFPRSKLARAPWAKPFVFIKGAISFVFGVGAIISFTNHDFRKDVNWDDDYDQYYTHIIIILSILMISPFVHFIIFLFILGTRKKIARQMNNGSANLQPSLNDARFGPNQQVNLGNNYQPPNYQLNAGRVQAINYHHPHVPQAPLHDAHQVRIPNIEASSVENVAPSQMPNAVVQPVESQLPGRMSHHPYINQEQPQNDEEEESSLLRDENRRSSINFRPGIN